jgi:predicted enzyme related to lactoylglutathione lyase
MPPTDVPGVGRMLALQDPQGAMLMAVAYIVPDA